MLKILIIISFFFTTTIKKLPISSGFILMDMESLRVLDGRNIHNRYLTASIAKTLTAYVAICEGNLDDVIEVDEETTRQEGSRIYLEKGEKVTLRTLLYGLLLRSGNDAAYAVAIHIGGSIDGFCFLMNEYAKIIGMANSTFENPSGLDESSKNYSTPYDMACMISKAYENPIFKEIFKTKKYCCEKYIFYNKHRLILENDMYGGKTGYTKKAGRTLITTAEYNNKKVVVVTFNDSDDWNTHRNLIQKTITYKRKLVVKKQILISPFPSEILPEIKENIYCLLKDEEKISIKAIIETGEETMGRLDIYINNTYAFSNCLYGYNPIEKGR